MSYTRLIRRLAVALMTALAFAVVATTIATADGREPPSPAGTAAAEDGLVVQDMNHGTTALQMAQSLLGGGVTISNVTFTGAPQAGGSFVDTGPGSVVGFNSGIILGSGSVQTTGTSTSCSKGVEGPNQCDGNTTVNSTPGDADLTTLSGKPTFDAAVLEFDFVPQFSTAQFTYVFTSDEYNEFSNSPFNDTFAFLINGTNCAVVPSTSTPVGVNTINGGNPLGTNAQNPSFFRNNDLSDGGGSINTEMDGLTTVLTCGATVSAGQTNHIKLAISDASDSILDSNVFIEAGSFVSGTQVSTSLSGSGASGPSISVVAGSAVTDQATLAGVNAASASGTIAYNVYTDSGCNSLYASGGTKPVTSGTAGASDAVTFNTPGTYYWQASYSGDTLNNPSKSGCGDEVLTVTAPPVNCGNASRLVGANALTRSGRDTNLNGLAEAFQATANASGTARVVCVYVDATSTVDELSAAIYSDNGSNHPGALLSQGSLVGAPVPGTFNTIQIPPAPLAAGTKYWIALLTPLGATGTFYFRDHCCGFQSSPAPNGPSENSSLSNLTGFPASWTTGKIWPKDGWVLGWGGGAP